VDQQALAENRCRAVREVLGGSPAGEVAARIPAVVAVAVGAASVRGGDAPFTASRSRWLITISGRINRLAWSPRRACPAAWPSRDDEPRRRQARPAASLRPGSISGTKCQVGFGLGGSTVACAWTVISCTPSRPTPCCRSILSRLRWERRHRRRHSSSSPRSAQLVRTFPEGRLPRAARRDRGPSLAPADPQADRSLPNYEHGRRYSRLRSDDYALSMWSATSPYHPLT